MCDIETLGLYDDLIATQGFGLSLTLISSLKHHNKSKDANLKWALIEQDYGLSVDGQPRRPTTRPQGHVTPALEQFKRWSYERPVQLKLLGSTLHHPLRPSALRAFTGAISYAIHARLWAHAYPKRTKRSKTAETLNTLAVETRPQSKHVNPCVFFFFNKQRWKKYSWSTSNNQLVKIYCLLPSAVFLSWDLSATPPTRSKPISNVFLHYAGGLPLVLLVGINLIRTAAKPTTVADIKLGKAVTLYDKTQNLDEFLTLELKNDDKTIKRLREHSSYHQACTLSR